MAEPKTKETKESVSAFLKKIPDKIRRDDCLAVVEIMREATGEQPKMWGSSIVGFGRHSYKYASGREIEWPMIGFSPRKGALTLYLMPDVERSPALMKRLGKHKTSKACVYIKRLADVDLDALKELVNTSVNKLAAQRVRQSSS